MNRREFLKHIVATAAVGAVAPRVLAEPVAMGVDTAMGGASRVAVGGTVYEIGLDMSDWSWKWLAVNERIRKHFDRTPAEQVMANIEKLQLDSQSENAVS